MKRVLVTGGAGFVGASVVHRLVEQGCAVALLLMAKMKWLQGRHLALYLSLYAALRFALETQRENTPILGPLTYYQLLAMALFALAGGTLVRRSFRMLR